MPLLTSAKEYYIYSIQNETEDESGDEIEVKKFKYKGREYLRDINDDTVYTGDGKEICVSYGCRESYQTSDPG